MAPVEVMNWSVLKTGRMWQSLREIAPSAKEVGAGLYRLAKNTYAIASLHDENLIDGRPGAPFVTSLLWAETEGAARRCVHLELERDESSTAAEAPHELLQNTSGDYESLVAEARKSKTRMMERAEYRTQPDGRFVHRVVEVGKASYFFRDAHARKNERPYAIRWRLDKG